ncbi:MAG TPA: GIY-YIG nuclease family protein [Allosphingosinicella sp.]|nr:GIY-YIG nuclease family protein [Allosphingosinicella sp.]
MAFWAYMLHCADRTFYVGHTDDLDARIGAHQSGLIPGYAATRLPVMLVWADEFPTRYEALQAERQIKGWSRAKKLAPIRSDWALISQLARNSTDKKRALTGPARTEPCP